MLVIRGRRANLLLAPGRSRRLLLRTDLRDKVVATRAKAKVNHSGVGDTSGLLAGQGKERVSIVTSLETLDGIALRGRDPRIMEHHRPNHHWDMYRRSLFLLTSVRARGTSISPRVRHRHWLFQRQAREAKAWVEIGYRAHMPGLWGPKGVFKPLHLRLSFQINWIYKVCFYSRS